jgi:putative transposase
MSQCMLGGIGANRSLLVVETQKGPSMRLVDSIFGELLEPIDRRWFQSVVDRCDGEACDKSFKSWDHIVALIFAQLGGADSLRAVEAGFNANAHHHYHLGVGPIARSTLSDASARRPVEVGLSTPTLYPQ